MDKFKKRRKTLISNSIYKKTRMELERLAGQSAGFTISDEAHPISPSTSIIHEDASSISPKPHKMEKVAIATNRMDVCSNIVPRATTSAGNLNVHSCSCCPEHKTGDSLKQLIEQEILTRHILQEVLEDVRTIRAQINTNNPPSPVTADVQSIFEEFEYFPIDSDEEMQILDEYLKNREKFKAAAKEISKIGGSSLYDFAKRCLTPIITNNYASEYSWYGQKKKKKFGQLKLAELLQEAADLTGLADNKKSTEEVIKRWLVKAKERYLLSLKKDETIMEEDNNKELSIILPAQ